MISLVLGLQWGDEGKGKIVDFKSDKYDIVARYQGGDNAGHTICVQDKTYKLNLIPSGIFRGKNCVIGNGVVVNLERLDSEIKKISDIEFNVFDKLFLSQDATIILPMHMAYEQKLNSVKKIRSTDRGIGPAYLTKCGRVGLKVRDLEFPEIVERKIKEQVELLGMEDSHINSSLEYVNRYKALALKLCTNTKAMMIQASNEEGYDILLEGAQGVMLDLEHGAYPYVTCSSPSRGGAILGSGLSNIEDVIGVTKLYCTKVGGGSFPTKDTTHYGERMGEIGKEFGVVTGRKRDCGWLDLVALKYAVDINGVTELALTKCDVLNTFDKIKLCIGYNYNGKIIKDFNLIHPEKLGDVTPVYREFDGWLEDLNEDNYGELFELHNILEFIEDYVNVTINMISFGPERNQTITHW